MSKIEAENLVIRPEPTPNPATVRFVLNFPVVEGGTADIRDVAMAKDRSPLAERLFGLDHVKGVFLGSNFVTITAGEEVNWQGLAAAVIDAIRDHLAAGNEILVGDPDPAPETQADSDAVAQGVIKIIDEEIRPAVAMDGGDIVFGGFKEGVVYLHLRGSCHGCPSSLMTLKVGIERRLQEEFPEIQAVEAV